MLIRLRYLFLLLTLTLARTPVSAQGPCIDPLVFPQPTYSCPPDYYPVCGCNGVTYRNPCEATYRAGLQYYAEGSCTSFDFDFLPTYTNYYLNLKIYKRERGYVLINIWDVYGINKLIDQVNIPQGLPPYEYALNVSQLETGIYLLEIYSGGDNLVKKFYKY
ncbi:hypothetical protein BH11BAC2_BH11BAC2_08780 [soil metagenome]